MAKKRLPIALLIALLTCMTGFAQGYLSALDSNKKVVSDFYRLVFEPRNADLADQFMTASVIEHDPRSQSGVENFVKFLKTLPVDTYDVGDTLRNPPALVIAEGELVTYVFKILTPDPQDKSKTYERFSFETYRIQNRKIVEHWSSASK